jgi:hypothetical protein
MDNSWERALPYNQGVRARRGTTFSNNDLRLSGECWVTGCDERGVVSISVVNQTCNLELSIHLLFHYATLYSHEDITLFLFTFHPIRHG